MDTEIRYFEWLIESIDPEHMIGDFYRPVYEKLYSTDFRWFKKYDDDENRAKDGVNLRSDFKDTSRKIRDDFRAEFEMIDADGGDVMQEHWYYAKPASCMEVLISIARRIEYDYLAIPGEENVPKWFWTFVDNMGIGASESRISDERYVDGRIQKWLSRKYEKNGEGGIFVTKSSHFDMPKLILRQQMNIVINENIDY